MAKQRIGWIESMRFLAFFLVFTVHYIAAFKPELFRYWEEGWTSYLLMGLTGKFAVALFSVILGYFAAAKLSQEGGEYGAYVAQRYLQFVAPLFIVNFFMSLNSFIMMDLFGIRQFFRDSFFFTYEIVPTFWCMEPFFLASLVIGLIAVLTRGEHKKRPGWYAAALLVSLLIGETWIGICLMGAILYTVQSRGYGWLKNVPVKIVLAVCAYLLLHTPESTEPSYFRDGIACIRWGVAWCFLLLVIFNTPMIQKPLDMKALKWLGSMAFALYLVHMPVQKVLAPIIIDHMALYSPQNITMAAGYCATFLVDVLLACILNKAVGQITRLQEKLFA